MLHKYWISRKNTHKAERINPMPVLKRISAVIGTINPIKLQPNAIPSIRQKMIKTPKVSTKFISDDSILDRRNRYLGTVTFEKTSALKRIAPIPPDVASLKKENMILPQKT